MISVVIASYLGPYKNAAKHRDKKLLRAIDSIINQTYKNWEIIVVADGCEKTIEILNLAYPQLSNPNIRRVLITKCETWSGTPRNTGIRYAYGEYITYLDIDDFYGENHLQIIAQNLGDRDWIYYDDYLFEMPYAPRLRKCTLTKHECGTSNFTHKRSLGELWEEKPTYSHDYYFFKNLEKHNHFAKVPTPEYMVCHVPQRFDI